MTRFDSEDRLPILTRRATSIDAARLADFGARTFAETYGAHNTAENLASYLAANYGERQQRSEIEDADAEYVIAECGSELLGFALLHAGEPPACVEGHRAIEIRRFYVASEMHGRGVAATLMASVLSASRRRAADVLWLGVWEENARAIRFYEKQGFTTVGVQQFVLGGDHQTDLVMVRSLVDG